MKRILSAVAIGLVVSACTAKAGGEQVEKKIVELYAADGLTVVKATCPKAIEVKVGATFQCQVTFDNGESFTVDGTVTSKHGTNFEYNVPIHEPNFIAAKLEKNIAEQIGKQASAPQSVTCGPPGIHRPPADHKLGCDVVNASGSPAKLVVTFDPAGVAQGWEVVE